jgi:hypothetical protein
MDDYVESFYLLQRECVDFMLGRRSHIVQTPNEHLKTLRCAFAAYDSARSGDVVALA